MIIIRLRGGLGNQLFQYAFGRRLALDRGTTLKLDLTRYRSPGVRSFQLDAFHISAELASTEEVMKLTHRDLGIFLGPLFRMYERKLPYSKRSFIREEIHSFDPVILGQVGSNIYLSGYWQSEKYFSPISQLLREELKLRRPLSVLSQTWADTIRSGLSISLHIRRGDYVENGNRNLGPLSSTYFTEAIAYISTRFPETTLFIFSDDMEWAQQNIRSPLRVKYVEANGPFRDQEELILMSLCDHHIISNSTYSWWGAWLGTFPEKIVVAPRQWFNNPGRNTSDLIPEIWVRL